MLMEIMVFVDEVTSWDNEEDKVTVTEFEEDEVVLTIIGSWTLLSY